MKSASELQRAVQEELEWEPSLNAAEIGVGVTEGVVTLSGHVGSYVEKRTAEKATKRVSGVRGVANELVVNLPAAAMRDDTALAQAALDALKWHLTVPEERVRLTVSNGWITLEGEVDWQYQRDAVSRAVRDLVGVKGVVNQVRVKPRVTPTQVKDKVEAAFRRSADIDAKNVQIEVEGSQVTLRGHVRSWAEYEDAEWAAWSAPGVVDVVNRLVVEEEVGVLV